MIVKYLQRICLKHQLPQVRNAQCILLSQPFSVVGHRTFGYDGLIDNISHNMFKLNRSFSQKNNELQFINLNRFFAKLNNIDNIFFIKMSQIPFENQTKRPFNIFEVLAYYFFQSFKVNVQALELNESEIKDRAFFFFDNLEKTLQILKEFEMQIHSHEIRIQLYQKQKFQYITNCGMQFARRQIRRRFIQLCYYEYQQTNKNNSMHKICKQIERQFSVVAGQVKRLITQKLDHSTFYYFLDEFDKSTNDLLVHKSVKSEIRSMYEENIQKAYYTPLRHTKDSFRFTFNSQVQTMTFIPSSITKLMYQIKDSQQPYTFVEKLRYLGTSSSAMQVAILSNYIGEEPYLIIPSLNIDNIRNTIHIWIIESFWRHFSRQKFILIQNQLNKFKKYSTHQDQLNYDYNMTLLIELFDLIHQDKNANKKIVKFQFDQFQDYWEFVYDHHQKLNKYRASLKRFINYLVNQSKFKHKIFLVKIGIYKHLFLNQYNLSNDDLIFNQFKILFKQQQGKRILVNWLKICLDSVNFINYQSIQNNPQLLSRVEVGLKNLIQKLKTSQILSNILYGNMQIIKKCAQMIVDKIIKNLSLQLNFQQQLSKYLRQGVIKSYTQFIEKWVNKNYNYYQEDSAQNQYKLLKYTLCRATLCHLFLNYGFKEFHLLYVDENQINLPYFLLNQKKMMLDELKPYASQIWKSSDGLYGRYQTDPYNQINLYLMHKHKNVKRVESGLNILFHMKLSQMLSGTDKQSKTQFIKLIVNQMLPLKNPKYLWVKTFSLTNLTKQEAIRIAVQKSYNNFVKSQVKQKIYIIIFKTQLPACFHLIIKLQKNKKNQIISQLVHIQATLSSKAKDIQQRIYSKKIIKKVIQNTTIEEKEGIYFSVLRQMKKKQIVLKNYKTLIMTGHKYKQIFEQIKQLKKNDNQIYQMININKSFVFFVDKQQLKQCLELSAVYSIYCKNSNLKDSNIFYDNSIKKQFKKLEQKIYCTHQQILQQKIQFQQLQEMLKQQMTRRHKEQIQIYQQN